MEGEEEGGNWLPNKNLPKLGCIVARWVANNLGKILKTKADEEKIKFGVTSETREAILRTMFGEQDERKRLLSPIAWLERHPSLLHDLTRVDWNLRNYNPGEGLPAILNRYCVNSLSYLG